MQKQFYPMYPDYGGLPVNSYAGVSTPKDTMSYELYGPWAILKSISGDNDGIVPRSSRVTVPTHQSFQRTTLRRSDWYAFLMAP
jgi:hypothetical protein